MNQEATPEQRDYNKLAKRRSREKAKQNRLAAQIPSARDYEPPSAQREQLRENAQELIATISAELPYELTAEEGFAVEMMADVIVGHERKWTKEVHSPYGTLYGRFFADAAASDVIDHFGQNPAVLESPTLAELYQRFLKLVRKLSKQEWFDKKFAQQIQNEMEES